MFSVKTLMYFDSQVDLSPTLPKPDWNPTPDFTIMFIYASIISTYLQATVGPCNTPKPSMLDFVNKAKWDAWKSLGSITQVRRLQPAPCGAEEERAAFHQLSANQDEARQDYCHLIGSLVAAEGSDSTHESSEAAAGSSNYETLLVSRKDNVTTITLNRPSKKNAITNQVCPSL